MAVFVSVVLAHPNPTVLSYGDAVARSAFAVFPVPDDYFTISFDVNALVCEIVIIVLFANISPSERVLGVLAIYTS